MQTSPDVYDNMWLVDDWKLTNLDGNEDSTFSAKAAVGVYDEGLDVVVVVNDPQHVQNESPGNAWKGHSVQLAIDSEGLGIAGGQTEFIAALSDAGPVLWKLYAADPRGDIPARWTQAGRQVQYGEVAIERKDNATEYRLRITWSEVYPLAGDTGSGIRLSLVVNDNDGGGRRAYLEWGGGVASDKKPSSYGLLTAE